MLKNKKVIAWGNELFAGQDGSCTQASRWLAQYMANKIKIAQAAALIKARLRNIWGIKNDLKEVAPREILCYSLNLGALLS